MNRTLRSLSWWPAPLALALVLASCDGSDPSEPNAAPTVSIQSPANGAVFAPGASIVFEGTANDPEDGELTGAALVWESGADGALGTTGTVTASDLSLGSHVITLTATDGDGETATASITIEVRELVERIAVSRGTPSGGAHIVTMDPDGGGVVAVTEDAGLGAEGGERGPAWSASGVRLAFSARPADAVEGCAVRAIFTARPDGSDLQPLSSPGSDCPQEVDPVWEPGGTYVAFCRISGEGEALVVQAVGGDEVGGVTLFGPGADSVTTVDRPRPGCHPDWSPGGRYILFDDLDPGTGFRQVVVWDLGESSFFTFSALSDEANNVMGRWSPDGSSITFVSDRDGSWDVFVLDLGPNELHRLTTDAAADLSPSWSPTGERIAFESDRVGGAPQVFVMDRDGSAVEQVTGTDDATVAHREPDWFGSSSGSASGPGAGSAAVRAPASSTGAVRPAPRWTARPSSGLRLLPGRRD